jgi:Transposase DDE domain group 1
VLFRGDAAFAKPEVYEFLEARDVGYAIRLPSNGILEGHIAHLLKRPEGQLPARPIVRYHEFTYQAGSWAHPKRVVAKVEWNRGELLPRWGFIVTNLSYPPKGVTRFYNGRGTAEQWIKEGKYTLNWTRLSCHKFVANQVRLALFVLAYNLGNFLRRLALPEAVKDWSLRSVHAKLIKTGGRLVRHARRLVFHLAAVAFPGEGFAALLDRIGGSRSHLGSERSFQIVDQGTAMKDTGWPQGAVRVVTTGDGQNGMGVSICVPIMRALCRQWCRGLADAGIDNQKVYCGRLHSSLQGSGRLR